MSKSIRIIHKEDADSIDIAERVRLYAERWFTEYDITVSEGLCNSCFCHTNISEPRSVEDAKIENSLITEWQRKPDAHYNMNPREMF